MFTLFSVLSLVSIYTNMSHMFLLEVCQVREGLLVFLLFVSRCLSG